MWRFALVLWFPLDFFIIGMEYALLLGVLAMFTSVVPYLGPLIAITPAVIIAIVTSPVHAYQVGSRLDNCSTHRREVYFTANYGEIITYPSDYNHFRFADSRIVVRRAGVVLGIPGYALLKVVVTHLFKLFKIRYNKYEADEGSYYEEDEWLKRRERNRTW